VWLCKGFESGQAKLPHQICADELSSGVPRAVLSGPSFAEEVARGLPAALTLASADSGFARNAARALHGATLRIYLSEDVAGVEAAGAVKNVIAIAAGVCDGLELGLSARAALVTRGLAEITRLGVALGGQARTLAGLAGLGDLVLTCTGSLSRNRALGVALARGQTQAAVEDATRMIAEGARTVASAVALAERHGVALPICGEVAAVLFEGKPPREALTSLLSRAARPEDEA